MNPLPWLNHPLCSLWTQALLHFLWQGAVLAALAGLARSFARPSTRYAILVVLFVAMTACPMLTVLWLRQSSNPKPHLTSVAVEPAFADVVADHENVARKLTSPIDVIPSATLTASDAWWPRLQPSIFAVWCLGASLFLVRLALGTWGLSQWMRSAEAGPRDWTALSNRLRARLGMKQPVCLRVSDKVCEPLAFWWWRPVILLPAAWLAEVPPHVLESVVAHELAHLRRCDVWVNFYQRLGETVLFYHPGIWWVSRQIRLERELCCDAIAVRLTGEPVRYAQALEYVARQRLEAVRPILAAGMGGTEMTLLERIQRVLGIESPRKPWESWPLGLATLAIVVAGGMMLSVTSQSVIGDEPTDPVTGALLAEEDRPAPPDRPEGPRGPEGRDPGPRREGPPPPRRGEFGPPDRGPGPGPGRRHGLPDGDDHAGPHPGSDPIHELMRELRALREEVARLRDEVRSLRGDRGPGGPDREFRGPPRGRGDGERRPPREGDFGPGRRPDFGPPEGERRGPPGPPRGEGPDGRGPRDDFRPPRDGERDGRRGPGPDRPPVEEPSKKDA
jgi:beta-lactamase regulating signal transducer with metallopeptidase domain